MSANQFTGLLDKLKLSIASMHYITQLQDVTC